MRFMLISRLPLNTATVTAFSELFKLKLLMLLLFWILAEVLPGSTVTGAFMFGSGTGALSAL
jgi:hypothetical protein